MLCESSGGGLGLVVALLPRPYAARPPRLFSSLSPRPRQMFGFSAIIVEEAPSKISQVANEKKSSKIDPV